MSRNGKDVLLVPVENLSALVKALNQIMGDGELRERLGQQASVAVSEQYDLNRVLTIWDSSFNKVKSKKAGNTDA